MSGIWASHKDMENKKIASKYGFRFFYVFLYINQPSSMFAIGNFETIIPIYVPKSKGEVIFCKGMICSAVAFIISYLSYSEDGTTGLTLNRPGFLESSTAGGGGGSGFRPPV